MNPSLAVIGCGYWGRNLVRVFAELGALRCVCDTDKQRYEPLKFAGSPPAFTDDLQEVLADPQLPAVAIATPAATHYDLVRRSLEAGKDVFVEKPLALNARQGEELVALAQRRAAVLMVGHILLYHPAVVKLRQLVQQGALGRILYCYSNRLNMGLIRTEENILWSFAPHDISVILHLLGEEPIAAEADGQSYLTPGVVDVTLSRLKFKSGANGHIFVSWLHPSKEQRLVIVGTEKMAVFDDTAEKKLLLYPHHVDWIGRTPKAVKAEPVVVELDKAEPLKEECRHFLDCIVSRKTPLSDGREGLRVLRVLDACQQSLERRAAAPPAAAARHGLFRPPQCLRRPALLDRRRDEDLAFLARHEGGRRGSQLRDRPERGDQLGGGDRQRREDSEQRLGVRCRHLGGWGVLRAVDGLYQRHQPPQRDRAEKRIPPHADPARAPLWGPTARSSAAIPWGATPSWPPGRW